MVLPCEFSLCFRLGMINSINMSLLETGFPYVIFSQGTTFFQIFFTGFPIDFPQFSTGYLSFSLILAMLVLK